MSLSVENEVPKETPLAVDMEVVEQILANLVDNACKYAASADDRTIHLVGRVEDGALALGVRDHGPGVGPEHAKAIFSPFDRGARGGGDATPGVGLGLALARGQARDLGGDLQADPPRPGLKWVAPHFAPATPSGVKPDLSVSDKPPPRGACY
jgi:K+-sensing histidine kinase KdpD